MKINIAAYKNIVILTGAGVSAGSGLETYRGQGGVWDKYNVEEYGNVQAFLVPKLSLGMPTFKLCLMFNRDEYHYSLCFSALHTGYATINYSDEYIR
jgi:NAD-dependent SIR2 family protein deacetylase